MSPFNVLLLHIIMMSPCHSDVTLSLSRHFVILMSHVTLKSSCLFTSSSFWCHSLIQCSHYHLISAYLFCHADILMSPMVIRVTLKDSLVNKTTKALTQFDLNQCHDEGQV